MEERPRFIANGLQNLALMLFGALLLQPLLNASLSPDVRSRGRGGCTDAVWQMLIEKPKRTGTP